MQAPPACTPARPRRPQPTPPTRTAHMAQATVWPVVSNPPVNSSPTSAARRSAGRGPPVWGSGVASRWPTIDESPPLGPILALASASRADMRARYATKPRLAARTDWVGCVGPFRRWNGGRQATPCAHPLPPFQPQYPALQPSLPPHMPAPEETACTGAEGCASGASFRCGLAGVTGERWAVGEGQAQNGGLPLQPFFHPTNPYCAPCSSMSNTSHRFPLARPARAPMRAPNAASPMTSSAIREAASATSTWHPADDVSTVTSSAAARWVAANVVL